MEKTEIVRQAWEVLGPEIEEQGCELVEVESGLQGSSLFLRLFLDKEGGITIDDCASMSRYVSALLDKDDFIGRQYNLEVSSPGIERPVRKVADFVRFAGERIKIHTVSPIEGRRKFTGELLGCEDGLVSVDVGSETVNVHIENVKRARLDR
ncbi:MAG: ribosome maturation factor RimP [Candidatus Hydrogenedentes bacterium]|nr:ribosome maturation factor RimP [Candidatus Hydrogenedentota bacterium]